MSSHGKEAIVVNLGKYGHAYRLDDLTKEALPDLRWREISKHGARERKFAILAEEATPAQMDQIEALLDGKQIYERGYLCTDFRCSRWAKEDEELCGQHLAVERKHREQMAARVRKEQASREGEDLANSLIAELKEMGFEGSSLDMHSYYDRIYERHTGAVVLAPEILQRIIERLSNAEDQGGADD